MEWIHKFHWDIWKVVSTVGLSAFAARVIVQWYVTEKRREVVVPMTYWWLSLLGATCLLSYSLTRTPLDWVFVASNGFNWIPFIRNILIHRRHQKKRQGCVKCSRVNPPVARYCMECGELLKAGTDA
jgi:lipid-A-disaccharide synthase-like uncharacterized protein